MKTLLAILILLLSAFFSMMPLASAHGICTGLQPAYVRPLYPEISKQSVKTGEDFTITGNITAITGNDLRGQLFLQTQPGPNGRFAVTSIFPSGDVFDMPANSVIPYSITVHSLVPGNYYVSAGINLIGIGKSPINDGCYPEPNIAVTGTPMCVSGMVAVSKTEDGSIFCIKSDDAQNIIQRGWAKEIISSVSIPKILHIPKPPIQDALQLVLSTNSTVIAQNQTLGIDVMINNTSSNVLVKDLQNNWPMDGLSMGPCQLDPVGIGVYEGNYTLENITSARLLQLYQNGTYNCPALIGVDRYVFEPSSDKAVFETSNGNHTGEVRYHASFDGFYTGDGFVQPKVGVYTILADDQWGHFAISHFKVLSPSEKMMSNLENDSGMVVLKNQTYYFVTPHYTHDAYFHPVQISLHDVVFTLFPSGFRGGLPIDGCGGQYYWTGVIFPDNASELLHIFVDSQPCDVNSIPVMFSNHTNPQAGLAFYDGKMKLLTSTQDKLQQSLVHNIMTLGGQNTAVFSISSRGGQISLSPTCPICTPEYFNETNTYTGNVGKIIPGYPVFVKISDPYSMSPRTDQVSTHDILPNGTFHYTINVTGKFGMNQYTLHFIYGNQSIIETLPVLPP